MIISNNSFLGNETMSWELKYNFINSLRFAPKSKGEKSQGKKADGS